MFDKFKSKIDKSGNIYTIRVNHEKRTYKTGYNELFYEDFITVDKKELNNIENMLIKSGYIQIF